MLQIYKNLTFMIYNKILNILFLKIWIKDKSEIYFLLLF